jgi:ABC-type multidrug transport system fused ATPase/permease subunit
MKEILTPSILTAVASFVISIITLYQLFRNQRFQQQQFNKTLERSLTTKLLDLRLEHYPRAFEITELIYKEKGGNYDFNKIKSSVDDLIEWKKGVINLIISNESLESFYALRDSMMKNPGENNQYSSEQIEKISKNTKELRKQLKRDLGFLFREEKNRRRTDKSL